MSDDEIRHIESTQRLTAIKGIAGGDVRSTQAGKLESAQRLTAIKGIAQQMLKTLHSKAF